jgi:hypothetical protein
MRLVTRLNKSLPNWYWFHEVGIASSPYQTGTGVRYFTQEGEGNSLDANSLSLPWVG